MRTPEYRVEKIGDKYVTVPVDHYPRATTCTFGVWAAVLALLGLRRGGLFGLLMLGAGGAMAYRCMTGECVFPTGLFTGGGREPRRQEPGETPSHQHDYKGHGQLPADYVDEAAMESFPASDPPSRNLVAVS